MAQVFSFMERTEPLPLTHAMTIVARDPSVHDPAAPDAKHRILKTVVPVPAGRFQPGPRGARFHVVDFDASTRTLQPPADLAPGTRPAPGWGYVDRFVGADDATLLSDPAFHAQNVYAIAARTLAIFEFALGRPVPWRFDASQLYLAPTAFVEPNAYYSDDDRSLFFGYFTPKRGTRIFTCLAHDIVAHETAHAILDGLRSRFDVPGLPDQAGFHEGFADIVALLSILATRESISTLIGDGKSRRVAAESLSLASLGESVLLTLGKEFGDALHVNRGGGLRTSVQLEPTIEWKDPTKAEWQEPHRRGEILAAAVMRTFLHMWTNRLVPIIGYRTIDRYRAAEEGALAAKHLLEMCIRAIDYCPPLEFEFEDYLTAMLASDREIAPNDEHGYRDALAKGFGEFGMQERAPMPRTPGMAERPSYRRYGYAALRTDPDEAFRFLWENSEYLHGLDTSFYLHVENVRPALRVGPRGFVVSETVVDYVQEVVLTKAELETLARRDDPDFRAPAQIPTGTRLKIWGGGTVIFDEFGGVKYHHAKAIRDWDRQRRRLEYMLGRGLWDTRGRLGFSFGTPLGQRFAAFHEPSGTAGEEW